MLTATWGAGRGQLGRSADPEANPEAPMSMAPLPGGGVLVLDQVNGRLVRYGPDGTPESTVSLAMTAPQDLAVAADGTVAVLDRLADRQVVLLGPDGRRIGTLPVEGPGIDEAGGVTAVFVDGHDVYLERENGPVYRIGDTSGRAASEREHLPGRPAGDGRTLLLAGLIDAPAGRFFVTAIDRASREHRFTRDISVPLSLRQILGLDADRAGIIYVAVAGTPYGAPETDEEARLLCLSPADGSTLGVTDMPGNTDPAETMRDLVVLPEGGVLYSVRSEEGMTVRRYDCRPASSAS
ncbi:MAG: hypothetical protein RMK74_06025 [Myxococcales bacterium]|nr:hypothetical protein [Myxococcales bacterium]